MPSEPRRAGRASSRSQWDNDPRRCRVPDCHMPHGSTVDMATAIQAQVERFAPGFQDRISGPGPSGIHVSGILLKLQVPDRTAAAIKAKDAGIAPTR